MKKHMGCLSVVLIFLICISNLKFISIWLDEKTGNAAYPYSNADGTSTSYGFASLQGDKAYPNNKTISILIDTTEYNRSMTSPASRLWEKYPNADTIVYRVFKKNPFYFWRWSQYIFGDERYSFPYKSWDEIKKRRPKNFVLDPEGQQF